MVPKAPRAHAGGYPSPSSRLSLSERVTGGTPCLRCMAARRGADNATRTIGAPTSSTALLSSGGKKSGSQDFNSPQGKAAAAARYPQHTNTKGGVCP